MKFDAISTPARRTAATILDFFMPPICLTCDTPVVSLGTLCPKCWSNIDFITQPVCNVTGIPLPFDAGTMTVSPFAVAHPPAYRKARAIASYNGTTRTLLHDFKYWDKTIALKQFARWLEIAGAEILPDTDLLVPVPLYWTRLWSRRFNQSAELAKALSEQTQIPHDNLTLRRVRRTRSQVGMTAKQRHSNVAGAFAIHPRRKNRIRNKNVVLVDDVITTGATVNACTKVLLRNGAQRVDILTIAMVTDKLTMPV